MEEIKVGAQSTLFPEVDAFTAYEQPLNERMRLCLRLEHLFSAINHNLDGEGSWDARNALVEMLGVCDLLTRCDVKGELIKELERLAGSLDTLKNNRSVDLDTLDDTIAGLSSCLKQLKSKTYQPGWRLKNDELAIQLKQRITIPGGACSFDLPAVHHWLNSDPIMRSAQLNDWFHDLKIIEDANSAVISLIRASTTPRIIEAENGFFQTQIEPSSPCQLVRVIVRPEQRLFPEISGGKHRFTIRFFEQNSTRKRPVQKSEDVRFELRCCGL